MDNAIRKDILARAKTSGYPGNIVEAFRAYDQGRDLVQEYVQQQQEASQPQMQVAQTPEEQEQGLRPYHEQGQLNQSMVFPDVQPNQSFNTMGMKIPINIDKVDKQGNLVESYKAVPPGLQNLPTGPYEGTVIESPARMQTGGVNKYQTAGEKEREDEAANTVYERMTRDIPTDAYDEFEHAYDRKDPYKAKDMAGMYDKSGRDTWAYPGNQINDPGTYANWINKKLGREAVMPLQKPWTGPYDMTGRTSPEKLPDLIDTSEPYIDSGIDYKTLTPSNPKNYSPRVADEDMIKTGGFKKQMGGSYQTNQEISMYEWLTGRPEESRKRYIVGGLKNRVLYNKAKYKR